MPDSGSSAGIGSEHTETICVIPRSPVARVEVAALILKTGGNNKYRCRI